MKRCILFLSIFILGLSNSISQEIKQEIFVLDFSRSNSKKFIVIKQNEQYIFKGINKASKEVQSCKWHVTFNKKQIEKFKISLEILIKYDEDEDENHIYKLVRKKNKIKLIFKKSKCSAEHKLYYFQKDCNRDFVIKMKINELERLLYNLKNM